MGTHLAVDEQLGSGLEINSNHFCRSLVSVCAGLERGCEGEDGMELPRTFRLVRHRLPETSIKLARRLVLTADNFGYLTR